MKMALSIIIDLGSFDRRWDLPPVVNGGVGRLNTFRYGPSDLASPDQFCIFSLSRREENYSRNIYLDCYVLDNSDSYSKLPSDIDKVVQLFCPVILVLVLLPMLIDYFNGCTCVRDLGIADQIKIMEEPVFTCWWLGIYLRLPSEKYKIVLWKKKNCKLRSLLVSFRLHFVIVKYRSADIWSSSYV
jgi:hypothetical protein